MLHLLQFAGAVTTYLVIVVQFQMSFGHKPSNGTAASLLSTVTADQSF
jgi:hypothetical protein